ncbi:hypothetical protein ACGTN6_19575 [Halomonas sp. THAF12]|uniref:hypothetical protein n=1 Tax=Halomonas sp. B23F22_10 TaxID=3459515 RepID=UPI00373EA434
MGRSPDDAPPACYTAMTTPWRQGDDPVSLEAGSWKLEAGSWKLEAGSWKLEAGSWKLEAGSWKLEAGSWKTA